MKYNVILDYLMKGIMFTFIVTGLSQSLIYALFLPVPVWTTFLLVFAMYLILSVVLWNVWSSILFFPVSAFMFWMYSDYYFEYNWISTTMAAIEQMVNYVSGYGYIDNTLMIYLAITVVVLMSLIFYAFIILMEMFLPTITAGLSLIFALWYIGHTNILQFVWIFTFGILLMLAEEFRRNISNFKQEIPFGRWQFAALPLALAITVTAALSLPSETDNLRVPAIEEAAIEVNDFLWDLIEVSEPRTGFRLWQTGFAPTTGRLGGPVTLNHEIALTVTSPARALLRGAVLNSYTGYGWVDTIDDRTYEFNENPPSEILDIAFDKGEPLLSDLLIDSENEAYKRFNVEIQHTGIVTSVLFNTNKTIQIMPNGGEESFFFNLSGEIFSAGVVGSDDAYNVEAFLPLLDSEPFQEIISNVPTINWHENISRDFAAQNRLNYRKLLRIQRYYTRLPDTITPRMIELTQEIIRNADTPFEKALSIESYLQNNFGYTLRPPYTPEGMDFVDNFLFDLRIGYCTYFATAMAVMGRIAGLPTRYVEGFLLPPFPIEDDMFEVRQSNAHAWVEVYFPGVGWITFDPTPPIEVYFAEVGIVPGVTDGIFYEDYMAQYWETMYQMWMAQGPGVTGTPFPSQMLAEPEREFIDIISAPLDILPYLAITALILITAFILTLLLVYKLHSLKRDRLPYKDRIKSYFKEILWLMSLYQYPVEAGETPYMYADRVDKWLVNDASSMRVVTGLLVKSEFGGYELSANDIDTVNKFHNSLTSSIKFVLGKHRFYKALLVRELYNLKFTRR